MAIRIAVMQPYFIPYAGYFRLFSTTDLFVVYDCVQFPRRGWVHRNRLLDKSSNEQWLTLPIKKAPRSTLIKDLEFSDNVAALWQLQLKKLPDKAKTIILQPNGNPIQFIANQLKCICDILNIPFNVAFSSSLKLDSNLKSEERILTIAKSFGATEYINASGGKLLYDEEKFSAHDIKLQFLPPYQGSHLSIIQRLVAEEPQAIRDEIYANS